jgi:hypothetical protein
MVAQMAAIAMTDLMKRMCDFPPPMSYRLPYVHSAKPRLAPTGTTVL